MDESSLHNVLDLSKYAISRSEKAYNTKDNSKEVNVKAANRSAMDLEEIDGNTWSKATYPTDNTNSIVDEKYQVDNQNQVKYKEQFSKNFFSEKRNSNFGMSIEHSDQVFSKRIQE